MSEVKQLGKFKVGQVWKTRDGKTVKITKIDETFNYPILASRGRSYSPDGLNWMDATDGDDLVELIQDTPLQENKSNIEDPFLDEHLIKQKDSTIKIYAKENSEYSPHVKGELLFKLKDTGNGYISKHYSHSSAIQDHYICMDYDEAEYLYQALKLVIEGSSK